MAEVVRLIEENAIAREEKRLMEEEFPRFLRNTFCSYVFDGKMEPEYAADLLEMSDDEFQEYYANWRAANANADDEQK